MSRSCGMQPATFHASTGVAFSRTQQQPAGVHAHARARAGVGGRVRRAGASHNKTSGGAYLAASPPRQLNPGRCCLVISAARRPLRTQPAASSSRRPAAGPAAVAGAHIERQPAVRALAPCHSPGVNAPGGTPRHASWLSPSHSAAQASVPHRAPPPAHQPGLQRCLRQRLRPPSTETAAHMPRRHHSSQPSWAAAAYLSSGRDPQPSLPGAAVPPGCQSLAHETKNAGQGPAQARVQQAGLQGAVLRAAEQPTPPTAAPLPVPAALR